MARAESFTVKPVGQIPDASAQSSPEWVERLKGQVQAENTIEGHPGQPARIAEVHRKMMEQAANIMGHTHQTGGYSQSDALHQLGIMGNEPVLGPASQAASDRANVGGQCPAKAPKRVYDIIAINLDITLNQWGDHFPGYMYVLADDLSRVREEEKINGEARKKENNPGAVSNGLQGDAIQPLVIRGNQAECVVFKVANQLDGEPITFRVHGSNMIVQATGKPAISTNPDSTIQPGKTQVFEWYIRSEDQEGGRMLQSLGNRDQTGLGLMGAFIVEPLGSRYLSPFKDGAELKSGWEAVIAQSDAPAFREFVIIYHEIGDESFRPLNAKDEPLPQRDPITDAYRPGGRALNFRSEPFGINMLHKQKELFGIEDEALAYSAYTFGDPPTPVPRSYLGDPAKFRIIHGGSEVFHSHHPHGGTIRWLRQPLAGDVRMFAHGVNGPVKYPVIRTKSDRVDVQMIGPSEAYDLDVECGSGLCQHLAADFLFHCHVAHHYVAGMWSFWRVYNTIQQGAYPAVRTDSMRELAELPDRKGIRQPGITSDQLVGKTVNWFDKRYTITADKTDWTANPPLISIKDWVEAMLPPQGKPGHKTDQKEQVQAVDATVLDWIWQAKDGKPLAVTEEESIFHMPKYTSPMPGGRFPILFEPKTGKTAWPDRKPHIGKRPPFAKGHNGAPWLEPFRMIKDNGSLPTEPGRKGASGEMTTMPARPGEQGRWSLCPTNAGRKQYTLNFIKLPITVTPARGKEPAVVDKSGLLFVLAEAEQEIRANDQLKHPIVIRANVYDCVDILLKSKWPDDQYTNLQGSKVNLHPHFMQFDNQASDGVITGMAYEQSIRPYDMLVNDHPGHGLPLPMNEPLTKPAKAGENSIVVRDAARFHVNTELGVDMDSVKQFEVMRIKEIKGNTITFTEPLLYDHPKDAIASVEFVRERWWVDADYGIVYFHDHAFGMVSWPHGAVGQVIAEPPGSTYHDPVTGAEKRYGPLMDIRTQEPIGSRSIGSFREMVLDFHDTVPLVAQFVYDGNRPGFDPVKQIKDLETVSFPFPEKTRDAPFGRLNGGLHTTGGVFNMRAESLATRLQNNPDPSQLFSSKVHGDPATLLLRAYPGDTLVIRALATANNETHTLNVSGHYFRPEQYMPLSQPKNTQHIGIAERYNLVIPSAGGPLRMPGDYLYHNGRNSHFGEGMWGLIRVLDKHVPDLQPLPGREVIQPPAPFVCPPDAPVKQFNVVAVDFTLKFHKAATKPIKVDFDRLIEVGNPNGKIYLLEGELARVAAGQVQPNPLTLRINVGDCMKVTLQNQMKKERAGFHVDLLAYDPNDSTGADVGFNKPGQTVAPGESRSYTYYAHPELGENSALIRDFGNVLVNLRDGLYGAVIIGPKGSKYRHPATGEDLTNGNSWEAEVEVDQSVPENAGRKNFRSVALFFQDEDQIMGTSFMPYLQNVAGVLGINYRLEPYGYRQDLGCDASNLFTCTAAGQDPSTPVITAHAGDEVVIHLFAPSSEQNGVFSIEGHEWPLEPFQPGADMLSAHQFGGAERLEIHITAGGPFKLAGDFLYMNNRMPYMGSGQWGVLRVLPPGDKKILALGEPAEARHYAEEPGTVKPVAAK
jgi:FtsP/CotA-like multicopper oxidase with cupredoxin domain